MTKCLLNVVMSFFIRSVLKLYVILKRSYDESTTNEFEAGVLCCYRLWIVVGRAMEFIKQSSNSSILLLLSLGLYLIYMNPFLGIIGERWKTYGRIKLSPSRPQRNSARGMAKVQAQLQLEDTDDETTEIDLVSLGDSRLTLVP